MYISGKLYNSTGKIYKDYNKLLKYKDWRERNKER